MTIAGIRVPKHVLFFWLMAAISIPVWGFVDAVGWDVEVYGKAIRSVWRGHDPYTEAMDVQKKHRAELIRDGQPLLESNPPYGYVYSPITLPVLRMLGRVPTVPLLTLYFLLYFGAAAVAIGVGICFCLPSEMPAILYVAGVALFFPGLLANGTIMGGNIAYILYGAAIALAMLGWRRGLWWPFYAAVLIASCIKPPLASLAIIGPLSAYRQWTKCIAVVIAALSIMGMQWILAPQLFLHYLEAVDLQLTLNQDFGFSPAGLFSIVGLKHGLEHATGSTIVYAMYAIPVFLVMLSLSRRYLRGDFSFQLWAPVLLTGTILMDPRIVEYDAAPITLPMALLLWRVVRGLGPRRLQLLLHGTLFIVANAASIYNWEWHKAIEGTLIIFAFGAGCWSLHKLPSAAGRTPLSTVSEEAQAVPV